MGSSGKHGSEQRSSRIRKGLVIGSGLVVAASVAAAAWVLVPDGSGGGGAESSQAAAATLPIPPSPGATPPATADGPGSAVQQGPLTPEPTPSATTTTKQAKPTKKAKPMKKAAAKKKATVQVVRTGRCPASYYGEPQQTASGETFNPNALTAASPSLAFGTKVRVTNRANGKSVTVRINDRGPYAGDRCLDLSTAAMKAVGGIGAGVIDAKYEILAA